MVDTSSRSSLIRLRVFEAMSVKRDCNKYRLVRDKVKMSVLCNTKQDVVKQKIQRAGVREDTFCPNSAVTQLPDAPGVFVVDEEAEVLLLDEVVSLAFDFVKCQVWQQLKRS
jgi:hypothetical protein